MVTVYGHDHNWYQPHKYIIEIDALNMLDVVYYQVLYHGPNQMQSHD